MVGIPGTYSPSRQIKAGAQRVLTMTLPLSSPFLPLRILFLFFFLLFLFFNFRQGLTVVLAVLELTEIPLILLPTY